MKVLHCIHSVNPAIGGPIEFIRQIVALHKRQDTGIEIACLDDPRAPWIKDFPCKVHALGPGFLSYGFSWRWVPWLKKNRKKYDIVVINGIWQFSSFGTWLALRDTDTPYVVFTHGMLDPWFKQNYPLKHLKKSMYWPWAEYWVLKDARTVMFTSEEEEDLAKQTFPIYDFNSVVVGYGAANPPKTTEELTRLFSEFFPSLAGKRVLLFLGRVHEKKGCDLLVEAFAQVSADAPELHLLIAGPAQEVYLARLKKLCDQLGLNDKVTFLGMLTGDRKWACLSYAEVMILPSHQENFGVVVAEALACGTPVLITYKVNIWREIMERGAGFVEHDTLEGTQTLINRWLKMTPEAKAEMSGKARNCSEKHFDVEAAFRRLMALFRQIIDNSHQAGVS